MCRQKIKIKVQTIMTQTKEKQLVPVLRFKDFVGEWENSRLYDLSNLITKGTTPKTFTASGVNYVKIEGLVGININKDKCLCIDEEVHLKELKRSILQEDDLLFAIAGATVGKVGIVTSDILPANTNQALAIIRLKDKEYLSFVLQILQSRVMKKYIYQSVSVGAQPNLNLEQIGDFKFHLPSLPEQQKIASFLSTVDEKIQQLTQKKALLEQYKKGVMQQLFSQKIRFKSESEYNHQDWKMKRLGEISDVTKLAGYEFTKHIVYKDKGSIIALRGLNVKKNTLDLNEVKYIDDSDFSKLSRSKLFIGDLLYTYVGTIGEVAIIDEDDRFYLAPNVSRIRFNEGLCLAKFAIQYFTNTFFKEKEVSKYISSSSQPALSMTNIRKFNILIPGIQEQQKIATYLSSIDTKIESVTHQITQTQTFKKGLLQKMFV